MDPLLGRPTLKTTQQAAPAVASNQPPDAQRMQEVMDELRALGAVDPAAQDQLMETLRQSDPAMWPLILQQFKATAAYRRRASEQTALAATAPAGLERLPATNDLALAPVATPQDVYPQTSPSSTAAAPADAVTTAESPSDPTASRVVQASYAAPAPVSGSEQLAAAIAALEAEIVRNPAAPDDVARQARLRLLYAAAGRRDDALRPIPAASAATQQFLTKEIEGLDAWLNAEQSPDAAGRAVEAKTALAEALGRLAESAPLVVRSLAFCTEVQSYGCAKRFEKYEFQPNQEVLLYAELENFGTERTPKGCHTSLRSNYQVVDSRGRPIEDHAFAATEEYCQNVRRDYFIGYHLRMPKRIEPGKYSLQLSVEDLKSKKVGQASIEFDVVEAADKKDP